MPPRMPLMQRKGGATPSDAPVSSNDSKGGSGSPNAPPDETAGQPHDDNDGAPDDGGADDSGASGVCQCPNCGCTFDAATGQVMDDSYGQGGQSDQSQSGQGGAPMDLSAMVGAAMNGGAGAGMNNDSTSGT